MGYQAKHAKKTKSIHIKKSASLLVALVLMIVVGTGTTLAYIIDQSGTVTNVFIPSQVSCAVKEDYTVKNTSDVDAYIRAAVVVTWKDDTTNRNVYGKQPVENTDYTIQYNLTNGWVKGTDGYYYWTSPVKSEREAANNCTTGVLIETCELKDGITPPSDYHLSVEIVAEAIQADPFANAEAAWAVTK